LRRQEATARTGSRNQSQQKVINFIFVMKYYDTHLHQAWKIHHYFEISIEVIVL